MFVYVYVRDVCVYVRVFRVHVFGLGGHAARGKEPCTVTTRYI